MAEAAAAVDTPTFSTSPGFAGWLAEHGVSLAFTTYQAGKLFFVGAETGPRLSIHERTFERCMGLCGDADTLFASTAYQVWRFDDVLDGAETEEGYDRLYVPQVGYTTGDLDIHDMALDGHGRLLFANTRFGCIATLSERRSFVPLWAPGFLSRLVPEDRCHLNGLALESGEAAYVSLVARTDEPEGWRDERIDGGVVMDVRSGAVVAQGLSMPHSPRVHDGELWVLESGRGRFGRIDRGHGRFEPVARCPGYARGLAFVGRHAVIGLSRPREETFAGLPLDAALEEAGIEPRAGLVVVDIESGATLHWLRIDGVVRELYDVVVLAGVRRAACVGFKSDDIRRTIAVGAASDAVRALSCH